MAEKNSIFQPEYAVATNPRVVQTRAAFRKALLQLLNENALDQISVRQIAQEAGIGYITFFRHYPSKEDLLQEVISDEIDSLVSLALEAFGTSDITAGATALFKYISKHRSLWTTLLTGGASHVLKEEFMARAMEAAGTRAPGDHWLPIDAAVPVVSSGTMELLAWWLRQKRPISVKKVARIYEEIVIEPVVNAYLDLPS